jgi:hypothetical protein
MWNEASAQLFHPVELSWRPVNKSRVIVPVSHVTMAAIITVSTHVYPARILGIQLP